MQTRELRRGFTLESAWAAVAETDKKLQELTGKPEKTGGQIERSGDTVKIDPSEDFTLRVW